MENLMQSLLELNKQFPPIVQFIVILLLLITWRLSIAFKNPRFRNAFLTGFEKKMNKITEDRLRSSPVFYRTEFYEQKVNTIKFEESHKNEVFRVVLKALIKSIPITIKEFLDEGKYKKVSIDELCLLLVDTLNLVIENYEKAIMKALQDKYGLKKGNKIFDYLMNASDGFRVWRVDHADRILFVIDNDLKNTCIYDNNTERVWVFLNEIAYSIRNTVLSITKQFKTFNGEFKRIITSE